LKTIVNVHVYCRLYIVV